MKRLGWAALWALLATGALAQDPSATPHDTLRIGSLFTNDLLGDGKDRWRSGSHQIAVITGPGRLPGTPGRVLEYHLRSEIIQPSTAPGLDRPYVSALSLGLHSHWQQRGWSVSTGADLVLTGPMTGLSELQTRAHRALSLPRPRGVATQLPNRLTPRLRVEAARAIRLGAGTHLRPYAVASEGPEGLYRLGADLMLGAWDLSRAMPRDRGTGHVIPTDLGQGVRAVLGADATYVTRSAFLPGGQARPLRLRARAGVQIRPSRSLSFFYGATWLSPEFRGQPSGQVVGSLQLRALF